jgi:hypothetical protein
VRDIRFQGTPENPALAAKARALANAAYPQIYRTLNPVDARPIPAFDIIFRKDLSRRYKHSVKRATQNMPRVANYSASGAADGRKVYLDAETLNSDPDRLDSVLVHEMAHLAQRYNWYRRLTIPYYWQEGIAEAIVFKTPDITIPADRPCLCSAPMPHYQSGYNCAAAFLLYLEKTYDPQLISHLNTALRRGSSAEQTFFQLTGRTLDQLWSEFLLTPNFTPMAAQINTIYAALGYQHGHPPRDVKARFKSWLARQPNGDEISRILSGADFQGRPITDIQALITSAVYFLGPGGAMLQAGHLQDLRRLPGIDDKAEIFETSTLFDLDLQKNPSPHEIRARKPNDPSIYHYQFIRPDDHSPWTLDKAWRTDPDGRLLQQYPMEPTNRTGNPETSRP